MKPILKPCPQCHTVAVGISAGEIRCDHCGAMFRFDCPLCNAPHHRLMVFPDGRQCGDCRQVIPDRIIAQMINNALVVDETVRCDYCSAPTLRRRHMTTGNRCFFFPACSGQAGLFSAPQESYVFLDFETTGLEIGRDCLLEVGAVKVDVDGTETFYQSMIRPIGPIPAKITTITGIRDDMVADAPPLNEVLKGLMPFIGSAHLVIHNADFDMPWLLVSLLRHGWECPNNGVICTLKWAKASGESHASLGALTKKYRITNANAHRALADAAATRELFFIFDQLAKPARPHATAHDYLSQCQDMIRRYSGFVQA